MASKLLSSHQTAALAKLASDGPGNAYRMRLSLGTLRLLAARGLVTSKSGLGSMFSPHTVIEWRITDAGRAALSTQGDRA